MTIGLSVQVRNARLDAIESQIGASPIIEIRSGSMPANCAAAATGSVLVQEALPADWLNAAASGTKTKNGTWALTGLPNIATTNAGYFRIHSAGSPSECHLQGTITATGGGGDMTLDNISIAASQPVTVNTFTLTDGNA